MKRRGTKNLSRDTTDVPYSRPAPKQNLRERIVAFLEANAPTEFQPKFISIKLKTSHEAVKKAIQREMDDPRSKIVRTQMGWYRIAHTVELLKDISGVKRLGIHGLQIEGKCPDKGIRYYLHKNAPYRIKTRGTYSEEFNGRPISIDVYQNSPTIVVWMKATKNPLDFAEFNNFVYWLYGWASRKIPESSWEVRQWGWNADFVNMDMTKSGFRVIKLKFFRNAWFMVYQKGQDLLRVETHMTPKDLSLQDILRIFSHLIDLAQGESAYQAPAEDRGDFAYR